jgi:hypothetical protein
VSDPNDPYAPPSAGHPQDQGTQPLPAPYSTGTPAEGPRSSTDTPVSPPAPAPYAPPTASYAPPYPSAAALPGAPVPPPGQYPQELYAQQPYAQQPYAQQPYAQPSPYGAYPVRRTNGLAITSLILGILWLYWAGSILALIFGYVALAQIRRAPADAPQDGRGIAIAGIVLGWVGAGTLLLFVLGLAALSTGGY